MAGGRKKHIKLAHHFKPVSFTKGKSVTIKFIFKIFILEESNRKEVKNLKENSSLIDITNCQRVIDYSMPVTCQILCRFGADKN